MIKKMHSRAEKIMHVATVKQRSTTVFLAASPMTDLGLITIQEQAQRILKLE